MLTGRESLIRLVGKRRRFLPNLQSLFSTPIQSTLNHCADKNGRIDLSDIAEERVEANLDEYKDGEHESEVLENKKSSSCWVACPVCGKNIRMEDYAINSHIDACLSRGTKRKLTQRTLLQLNFSSKAKDQEFSVDSLQPRNIEDNRRPSDSVAQNPNNELLIYATCKENDNIQCGLTDIPVSNYRIDYSVHPSLFSPKTSKDDVTNSRGYISSETLETFIVGRKYTDQKEIDPSATISLLLDPHNVKDANAIKVVSEDSGCYKVLGFLPRELAQYLSPLIEKYGLRFEGCVSSVPKNSLDVVPIQLICQNISDTGKEYEDDEGFKCLLENAQHVVESARNNPPNFTKSQQNFHLLLQEVLRNNSHLFTEDEKNFMESFTSLSDDSQRLFVRLYARKGPWFRISSISYTDILDTKEAVKGLSDKEYICCIEDRNQLCQKDMKDILNILTVSELREGFRMIKRSCSRGKRKQEIIASILSSYADGLCPHLSSVVLDITGSCISISQKADSLFWRAERLFFLNGEQDLSAFLLVDLGKVKYPSYNCIISQPIFSCRGDLLAYEEAIEVAQITDQYLDDNSTELVLRCIKIAESHISSSLPIQSLTSKPVATLYYLFSASWIYSKVVSLGISFFEQERRYSDAINLLKRLLDCFTCDGRRGYWTLRLSVDLEHLGYINKSLLVAEKGLLDPWIRAGSRMALQRRVLRLGRPPRRWKVPSFSKSIWRKIPEVHVQGRPLNCQMGTKSRFYNEGGEQCGVEQLALQYYAGEGGGWQGVHTESGIWLTIFGLLMWDAIFADVPNVFCTRFQNAPLDLDTDSFYSVRKNSIESHLQKIHDGIAEEILLKTWETHIGTVCRGVNWDRHSLSELRAAVTCVQGPCLASLCRHLAQDYRSWSSGMPDLLLWRFHGEYSGEAKLVEVKGPKDRLSEQQRAWLLLLMDCGFVIEVCKVQPAPLPT
ncbi:Fanconi-associated nuclease [Quillaja saponaria]|uniref:Fanconi-associated nuclease n=1 Tax=Quillaja saponaria TaxID=32244 RepID=A0AAD7QDA5_QUISA|nr:Fanconi-associated nuclease [Quillaja saponaria]